jgi:hypothetical protein
LIEAPAMEARTRVSKAAAAMDAIDQDSSLSPSGKAGKRREAAERALAAAKQSKTLEKARESVAYMQAKWAEKLGASIRPAIDAHEASIHSQVRDRLLNMKGGSKLDFLRTHATDPVVASAILSGPGFLCGLNETEMAMVRRLFEESVSPEIAQARTATTKAMNEVEIGWQRAIKMIEERGALPEQQKIA